MFMTLIHLIPFCSIYFTPHFSILCYFTYCFLFSIPHQTLILRVENYYAIFDNQVCTIIVHQFTISQVCFLFVSDIQIVQLQTVPNPCPDITRKSTIGR